MVAEDVISKLGHSWLDDVFEKACDDYGTVGYDFSAEGDVAIRRCGKTILEADRNAAAR